jgi:mitochondrial splicing suppressor protein 51
MATRMITNWLKKDADRMRARLPSFQQKKLSLSDVLRQKVFNMRPLTLDRLAKFYPPRPLFVPLSQSPHPQLRQMSNDIKQYSSDPVQLDIGDRLPSSEWDQPSDIPGGTLRHEAAPKSRSRPVYECENCGWPSHSDRNNWEMDKERHAQVCQLLRQWTEDEHDLRSGRPLWELNFPGRQPSSSVLNFTDWNYLFVTRKFSNAVLKSPIVQRNLSRLLTYPYTIASLLCKPWVYYQDKHTVTEAGWHLLSSLSHAVEVATKSASKHLDYTKGKVRFTEEPTAPTVTNDPFRIFILGAATECQLPPSVWEQLSLTFPGAPFRLYMVGPEACVPPTPLVSCAEPLTKYRSPTSSHLNQSAQQREIHFKKRVGTDEDSVETVDCSITTTVIPMTVNMRMEILPYLYHDIHEAFGPFRPNRDVFVLMNSGVGHPLSRNLWRPSLDKILKTRCLTVFTSLNLPDQQADQEAVQSEFEGRYQVVIRPTANKFASIRPDIPVDCVHDPDQWAYCNGHMFAIQGVGTDVANRREDFEIEQQPQDSKSWF